MIGVFAPDVRSAMLQLGLELLRSLHARGEHACLIVPEAAVDNCPDWARPHLATYPPRHSFYMSRKQTFAVRRIVRDEGITRMIMVISSLHTLRAGWAIKGGCDLVVMVHDVVPHTTRSVRVRLRSQLMVALNGITYAIATKVVVFSRNSEAQFRRIYPRSADKLVRLPLGSHVPGGISAVQPPDMREGPYVLFFGRLDRQKGIDRLLESLDREPLVGARMVIAGRGELSKAERALIARSERVTLIERFLGDAEMLWLFEHAQCVVLPYRDATQSGVIPLAYHFGRVVVVSDIPGLVEYVEPGRTGVVVGAHEEFATALNALLALPEEVRNSMQLAARCYSDEHLKWDTLIPSLLD